MGCPAAPGHSRGMHTPRHDPTSQDSPPGRPPPAANHAGHGPHGGPERRRGGTPPPSAMQRFNSITSGAASPASALMGTLLIASMLIATMALTAFGPAWTTFLYGVLAAAASASVSHAVNARWMVARRSAQLRAARARLVGEVEQRAEVERSLAAMREQVALVEESLPAMIVFVDKDRRVRYHNRAYGRWTGLGDDAIDGHSVEEIVGSDLYHAIDGRLGEAFDGHDVRYERTQVATDGHAANLLVQYLPHYAVPGKVTGVFALLTDITPEAHVASPAPEAPVEDTRARLASALERDEFTVQLQTIAPLHPAAQDAGLKQVSLRMDEEEAKHLPPGGFIALAEELGMLHEIDRWLVRHAIDQAATHDSRPAPIFVVSLSCAGAAKADFPDFVRGCLERRAVPGGTLCFELAEDDLMAESATCRASLVKLAAAGVRFCAAGVGRDLRRIARLKELGMNYVKLDAGIVLDMLRSPGGLAQVKAISQAAQAAGLLTIADCVETDCTRAALARAGIRYAQGTAVAQPRCADEPAPARHREAA